MSEFAEVEDAALVTAVAAGADLGGVFAEGLVPDIMRTIFYSQ